MARIVVLQQQRSTPSEGRCEGQGDACTESKYEIRLGARGQEMVVGTHQRRRSFFGGVRRFHRRRLRSDDAASRREMGEREGRTGAVRRVLESGGEVKQVRGRRGVGLRRTTGQSLSLMHREQDVPLTV